MSAFSPVVLFVYNRTDHLRRTLDALNENRQYRTTALYVFSDGLEATMTLKGFKRFVD